MQPRLDSELRPGRRLIIILSRLVICLIVIVVGLGLIWIWPQIQSHESNSLADVSWEVRGTPMIYDCTVTDIRGQPVEGVTVDFNSDSGWTSGDTKTDANGRVYVHGGEPEMTGIRVNGVTLVTRTNAFSFTPSVSKGLQVTIRLKESFFDVSKQSSEGSHGSRGTVIFGAEANSPFVFVYSTPAYPVPGKTSTSGLIAAIWDDGTVVRARSTKEIGLNYLQGKLSVEQLAEFRVVVAKSGILIKQPMQDLVVDAECTYVAALINNNVVAWAHTPSIKVNPALVAIEKWLLEVGLANTSSVDTDAFKNAQFRWGK